MAGVAITTKDKKYNKIDTSSKTALMNDYYDKGIQALYVEPSPTTPVATDNNINNKNGTSNSSMITAKPIKPDNYTFVEIAPWQYCAELEDKLRANGGVKKPLTAQQLYTMLSNMTAEDKVSLLLSFLRRLQFNIILFFFFFSNCRCNTGRLVLYGQQDYFLKYFSP